MDIEWKYIFQRSIHKEFFELVTNLTMDSRVIEVKSKLCPTTEKNTFLFI